MHTMCQVMKISAIVCIGVSNWSTVHAQISNGWFADFRPVPGLGSRFADRDPFVTQDGRTIYFASSRPDVQPETVDFSTLDIWMATRPSKWEAFGDAVKLESPISRNNVRDSGPYLSNDGLQLFFDSGSGNPLSDLFMARRQSLSGVWGKPESLGPAVNDPDALELSPSITADGMTIFFTSTRLNLDPKNPTLEADLFQATRTSLDQPFGSVMQLENVNTIFDAEASASVSSDGLTIFYDTRRGPWGWEEVWVATRSSTSEQFEEPMDLNDLGLGSDINNTSGIEGTPFISPDWPAPGSKLYYARQSGDWDIWEATWHVEGEAIPGPISLVAGDADQDLDFDQLDLVQVQIAAKYLTGQAAAWGEGDWNGAPGGFVGSPPNGDGVFNQLDIVAAQQAGIYLTGPYAAVQPNGLANDGQTSIVYNVGTGELAVDAPAGTDLTSINIDSAASIFTGDVAQNLGGSFDNDTDNNIFKATFGSSFGSLSFGNVAQPGLSEDFVANDLTVVGSLAGGGDLGPVDLIYVPEPAASVLAIVGVMAASFCRWRREQRP